MPRPARHPIGDPPAMTSAPITPRYVPNPDGSGEPVDISGLPQPIPTDQYALLSYCLEYGIQPYSVELEAALLDQAGTIGVGYRRLLDWVANEMSQGALIDDLRETLRADLRGLEQQIRAAKATLGNLMSDAVFDVEYAEGGQDVKTMVAILDRIHRDTTIVMALNPFPNPAPITSRKLILATAEIGPPGLQAGLVRASRNMDMGALAALVADGLGEFTREENGANPIPRITGVKLNAAGYHAAVAAGAKDNS